MALSGWVKLHRGLSDHYIASDPNALSVWVHLLMLANHTEAKRLINGRVVVVLPGQILTSRKSLSAKTGVQESKVERILSMLKSEQQIEQHGTAKFRLISIVNWDSYQSHEQHNEQQVNSKRTADEQQMNTLEEVSIPANAGTDTQECKECEEKSIGAQGKPERSDTISAKDLVRLGVNAQHAKDWLAIRKKKRAPLTQTAMDGVLREVQAAGITLAEAVRISAERGWQGFKADWLQSKPAFGQPVNRQQQVEDNNAKVVQAILQREQLKSGSQDLGLDDPVIINGEVINVD